MRDNDTLRGLDEQEQAARKAQEDAEKAKVAHHFRGRIEQQLTAELRKTLHLTLAGTAATFQLNGRVFTVTWHWHYQPITAGPRGREKEVR
ncbi:MAG TPA: hypothetical protein VGS80_11790 [Ktedonobacterales bacterium]|nr:hypothetical protein [Ktedonobacterales bacterium]